MGPKSVERRPRPGRPIDRTIELGDHTPELPTLTPPEPELTTFASLKLWTSPSYLSGYFAAANAAMISATGSSELRKSNIGPANFNTSASST